MNANVHHLLLGRHASGAHADRPAVISPPRTLSYAALEDLSARAASLLRCSGVQAGDRVVSFAPDLPEHLALILGAWRIGAVFVVGNQLSPRAEIEEVVRGTEPRVVLGSELSQKHLAGLTETLWIAGEGETEYPHLERLLAAAERWDGVEHVGPDHPAVWQYTQSSDGANLPVIHTHGAIAASLEPFADACLSLRPEDRCFSVAKLCFGYGFGNSAIFPLGAGASAILHPGRVDAYSVLDLIEKTRPTVVFAVPTFYAGVLGLPRVAERFALSSVRCFVSAGEELGAPIEDAFLQAFHRPLLNGIGSTEMFHIFIAQRPAGDRPGTLGTVTPGHEIRILDAAGNPVEDEITGELWVRGPHNGLTYAGFPERARSVFSSGWVRVGDRVLRGRDGYIRYRGRIDDVEMVSGQKVILSEVERALRAHPSIARARVEVSRGEDRLTRLIARVGLAPGVSPAAATARALQQHLREHLLPHKCPRQIDFEDS